MPWPAWFFQQLARKMIIFQSKPKSNLIVVSTTDGTTWVPTSWHRVQLNWSYFDENMAVREQVNFESNSKDAYIGNSKKSFRPFTDLRHCNIELIEIIERGVTLFHCENCSCFVERAFLNLTNSRIRTPYTYGNMARSIWGVHSNSIVLLIWLRCWNLGEYGMAQS